MNTNLNKTKKKLLIIFYFSILLIILLFWVSFLTTKYFKEIRNERIDFQRIIFMIEKWEINIDDIINIQYKINEKIFIQNISNETKLNKIDPKWFINYILINKNKKILSSNVRDNIEANLVIDIYNNDSFYKIKQKSSFLIKKFDINNWEQTFILFKSIRYSFTDYINDILFFFWITILFSLIIFIFSKKFINKLFIPIEENIKDMTQFIHNAGHELKTPISVIDSNIQLMDNMKVYDSQMTKELKNEILNLNSLIESLIKLSSIDIINNKEEVNINDTVVNIIDSFKDKIKTKNITTKVDIPKKAEISANKDYFYILISNLIWNAIKYNKDWWTITINYKSWELSIKDNGIWIKEEELDKIFNRFYQVDKSRNTKWYGIWLSLVKKIVDIHKWKIEVKSEKGKETIFVIKF